MKIVLFGAGASFGAGSIHPKPPPLGMDLFDPLTRLYPTWRQIPDEARSKFIEDFEDGMAYVIENHGFAVAPLMQEMAIFFSKFRPTTELNLYDKLFQDQSVYDDVLFATLNYECLLEFAAIKSNCKVQYFGEVKSGTEQIPIWKLHGSCNFKVKNIQATRGVSFGMGVTFGGTIELIEPNEVESFYSGNTALYPAMALYSDSKPISMAPGPVKEAQKKWPDRISEASDLCVIGVNPNMDDDHIWEAITNMDGTVHFVGGEKSFEDWTKNHRQNRKSNFISETWDAAENEILRILAT